MKTDANRGTTNIVYNYLGLQERIEFGENKRIENVYDAEGLKLIQRLVNGSTIIQTDYTGDLIYRNDTLISIAHDEGISRPLDAANSGFAPHFFYTDHLGNTRLIYSVAPNGAYMVQENHYGPFGELLEGLGQSGDWKFLYQGKEFIDGLGYDFHARNYDVWRGQFDGVDAVDHYGMGGTVAMYNNPISVTDPDGNCPNCITGGIGAIIGGFVNLGVKLYQGKINSFQDGAVAFGIGAAAGFVTGFTGGLAAGAVGVTGTGFAVGAVTGAAGAVAGTPIQGLGNMAYFGDPYSGRQYATDILLGGVMGGVSGGVAAWLKGKPVFRGSASNSPGIQIDDLEFAGVQKIENIKDVVVRGANEIKQQGWSNQFGDQTAKGGAEGFKFGGGEAIEHFGKHADQIMKVSGRSIYNVKDYINDANWIIQNGTYSSKLNGYYTFIANGSRGQSLFGFVGMKNGGSTISTFHIKSATQLGLK